MKKYWLFVLLLAPLLGQAKCTFDSPNGGAQTVNLDLTSGEATASFNINARGNIICNASSDKLYYATPLKGYIVAFQGANGKKILMKLDLTIDDFNVSIGNKTVAASEVLANKIFTITASYVNTGEVKQTVTGDAFSLSEPAVNVISENSCTSNWVSYLFCLLTKRLSNGSVYTQNLNFTVTHKPTTCHFKESQYTIDMPKTTLNEMLSGNNNKSRSTTLVLNCDGMYKVTTNPVSFKIVRGDWNENGTILRNTLIEGAKGVGFQIYAGKEEDNNATLLKLGDTLGTRIAKFDEIKDQYQFPVTAKYVRIAGEALRPGVMQSKVIFAVSYD